MDENENKFEVISSKTSKANFKQTNGFGKSVLVPFFSGIVGCSLVIGTCFGVPSIKEKLIGETTTTNTTVQTSTATGTTANLISLSNYSNTAVFVQKEIKVEDLINNVVKNLAIPIDIKQQNVIVNGSSDVMFVGDYNWQLEALTNIVKNCIEHTVENKNIYINWEENNFYTKIVIKDEGVGIDKKDVKHMFERFYKGKNSSENSVGIGLALAKSIIEKDNGYIICSSELGRGTTFEIKYMKP